MDRWLLLRRVTLALTVLLVACQPEIGDECQISTDCSAAGDRLCATDQPDGYCTIFNCEPGTCPEEAVCVGFGTDLSRVSGSVPACISTGSACTVNTECCSRLCQNGTCAFGCEDPQGSSRFQRTFCMARCDEDDDCRSGYECIDMGNPNNPWGAIIVENGASRGEVNGKVCAVPLSGEPVSASDVGTEVCTGTDAGFDAPPWTPNVPEAGPLTDASGAGGAAGMSGAGGVGGAGGVSGADGG